ncbi:hypothetical protein SmJEL517_g01696 [Synchytrium microbalum]|uniref:SprT-like domain-containing protein n=1 Tax=Synchytrium microbalum TaxID=1806994 RepID=A0A507C9M6_9FUNG|nr:uncharacterized protein SmJEL517_g01696 [Synchytrium microbalum]TPX35869.1 hypothetical protein SmJEL517_g01696 [Synchytrium microbalum]
MSETQLIPLSDAPVRRRLSIYQKVKAFDEEDDDDKVGTATNEEPSQGAIASGGLVGDDLDEGFETLQPLSANQHLGFDDSFVTKRKTPRKRLVKQVWEEGPFKIGTTSHHTTANIATSTITPPQPIRRRDLPTVTVTATPYCTPGNIIDSSPSPTDPRKISVSPTSSAYTTPSEHASSPQQSIQVTPVYNDVDGGLNDDYHYQNDYEELGFEHLQISEDLRVTDDDEQHGPEVDEDETQQDESQQQSDPSSEVSDLNQEPDLNSAHNESDVDPINQLDDGDDDTIETGANPSETPTRGAESEEESPIKLFGRRGTPAARRRVVVSSDEDEEADAEDDEEVNSPHKARVDLINCQNSTSPDPRDDQYVSLVEQDEGPSPALYKKRPQKSKRAIISEDDEDEVLVLSHSQPPSKTHIRPLNPAPLQPVHREPFVIHDSSSESEESVKVISRRVPKPVYAVNLDDSDDDEEEVNVRIVGRDVKGKAVVKNCDDVEDKENQDENSDGYLHFEPSSTRPVTKKAWSPDLKHTVSTPLMRATPKLPSATPASKKFKQTRESMAQSLYAEFNTRVFGNRLNDVAITWSVKLNKTAGRTWTRQEMRNGEVVRLARIELSSKVIDEEYKLRNTLIHELCHAASWIVDASNKPPHGGVFKKWGTRAERQYADIEVTTLHSYEISYKFHYQCTNSLCCKVLILLARQSDTKKDGTPRAPSKFALHVKDHFKATREQNGGASHGEIMRMLSESYKALNIQKVDTPGGEQL